MEVYGEFDGSALRIAPLLGLQVRFELSSTNSLKSLPFIFLSRDEVSNMLASLFFFSALSLFPEGVFI